MNLHLQWLGREFTSTNALRALFCIPQVMSVARSGDGARDIALSTWWMWSANNALGALFAGLGLHDIPLALSFCASLAGCLATIGLTLGQRSAERRRLCEAAQHRRDQSRSELMVDGFIR